MYHITLNILPLGRVLSICHMGFQTQGLVNFLFFFQTWISGANSILAKICVFGAEFSLELRELHLKMHFSPKNIWGSLELRRVLNGGYLECKKWGLEGGKYPYYLPMTVPPPILSISADQLIETNDEQQTISFCTTYYFISNLTWIIQSGSLVYWTK